jgi:hypothetical protein
MFFLAFLIQEIADDEFALKAEIEKALDYIYYQLGQLYVIHDLPVSSVPSEALINRALNVKSAVLTYIATHLSHDCNRLGIGGKSFDLNRS